MNQATHTPPQTPRVVGGDRALTAYILPILLLVVLAWSMFGVLGLALAGFAVLATLFARAHAVKILVLAAAVELCLAAVVTIAAAPGNDGEINPRYASERPLAAQTGAAAGALFTAALVLSISDDRRSARAARKDGPGRSTPVEPEPVTAPTDANLRCGAQGHHEKRRPGDDHDA